MSKDLTGQLLVASPTLLDPNFFRSVVLIIDHQTDGTMGLILNRPSTEPVEQFIPPYQPALAEPGVVFVGGPVLPGVLLGLSIPDSVDEDESAPTDLVDLHQPPPSEHRVRVFSGYAGWVAGQLEAELGDSGWLVVPAMAGDVVVAEPEQLWSQVLRRQGGRLAQFALFPNDPRMN